MAKKSKSIAKINEPERGLVPSREFGIADRAYGEYLTKLDPRNNAVVQLALAQTNDNRFKEFLDRLNVDRYKRMSLQTIAKACNISLAEFTQWYNKASTQAAIAEAQLGSIKITQDMIEDAKSREVPCERCDDLGFVAAQPNLPQELQPEGYRSVGTADAPMYVRTCPLCKGTKKNLKAGNQHARDKILEMSGIIKKGPGLVINQSFGGQQHESAVSVLSETMPLDITGSYERVD